MTVLDTSVAIDLLVGEQGAERAGALIMAGAVAAPDVIVVETLSVLRRSVLSGSLSAERASAALDDLADAPIDLFASLPLRGRAWELRDNFSAGDALFVALAERLEEPLATLDHRLARAAREHTTVELIEPNGGR